MKRALIALVLAGAVSACATPPDRIAGVAPPSDAYATKGCEQLRTEMSDVNNRLGIASNAQQKAATGDAWGVFLVGLPVSSMTGNDREAEVAVLKGQADAIGQEMVRKGCV